MTPLKSNPTVRNACPDGRLCQFARIRSELYPEARQFPVGGFTRRDESPERTPSRSKNPEPGAGVVSCLPNTTSRLCLCNRARAASLLTTCANPHPKNELHSGGQDWCHSSEEDMSYVSPTPIFTTSRYWEHRERNCFVDCVTSVTTLILF